MANISFYGLGVLLVLVLPAGDLIGSILSISRWLGGTLPSLTASLLVYVGLARLGGLSTR